MAWTVADYRARYAAADALTQEVQSFQNKAGIPAINELRNAGQHFLAALDDEGGIVSQADLDSAIGHARRASYEATEAGIVFAVAIVKKFQQDYARVELSGLVRDYAERCRACNEALELIEVGRQTDFDRTCDHQDRIAIFRTVRAFAQDLTVARIEANKKIAEQQRLTRRFILQVALTIFGIVVALISLIVTLAKLRT